MVTHYLQLHVQPLLNVTPTITTTFDLWMSRGHHDTFALVVNFLSLNWKPHHAVIGLFEANDTNVQRFSKQLKAIVEEFDLTSKVLCYLKLRVSI
jgi:hypothetical protein